MITTTTTNLFLPQEATNFGQVWKTPCLVVYKQVKLPKDLYNHTAPNPQELFTPFNMIQVRSISAGLVPRVHIGTRQCS